MKETLEQKTKFKKSSRRKYIIAAGIIFMLIVSLVFIYFTPEPKSDPASEKIIRKVASRMIPKEPNDLTDEDFAQITEFDIELVKEAGPRYFGPRPISYETYELSDIRLLAKFKNLQKLNLREIKIPDTKIPQWIKILAKLGLYNINNRYTLDLSPLEKLDHLEELHIGGPAVRDLKPLAKLNLGYLQLIGASVSNLKPIESLTHLKYLDIIFCPNLTKKDVEELKKKNPNIYIEASYILKK